MPPQPERPPDWRRAEDYSDLRSMDRPALAWELLRRNPKYRDAVAALPPTIAHEGRCILSDAISERVAAEWGLSFRRGSGPCRPRCPDLLARRCRPARRGR